MTIVSLRNGVPPEGQPEGTAPAEDRFAQVPDQTPRETPQPPPHPPEPEKKEEPEEPEEPEDESPAAARGAPRRK